MGQPLTPKLERIPASMRGRVEQSQAIAAQSGKMGLTGPPTPERVAAVREAIAERIASAKTEEDRKQVEEQQAKILDQIQTETINSAGMIVDMARRGDQLAAQFAPIIMEELGELREVEMQMARLDPSDETGMEEMREIRSEIIESIQSIVGTGAMPELIERTRNAPSEEDLAEQQQMQARVEQRMAQAQQRYVERQQQSQMSLTTDLQRIDDETQRSIDRIDPMVPKIVDLEDGSKKQLTY